MPEPATILIVDDEPFNVDYLEQELEDQGYATISASNGQEALDLVAADPPDAILLDVMMPVMDGFAACRILKENDETRLIPVIIMTALNAVEDRIKGIEAGADDFLTKPVDDRELRARLQTTLRLKKAVEDKVGKLDRAKEHFAKFVPEAVKQRVAENPDAPELAKRDEDVSVLFLDIVGYTRLSETIPPEELNVLTSKYFSAFLDRIHDAGGDISASAGDGLMIVFSDTDARGHALTACETALAIFDIAETLNASGAEHPLAFHMGINSGVASVGATRYDGQRNSRWVFTADGLVPSLASRLAGIAQADQIVLGPETVARVGDVYPLRPLGRELLKNIAEPIEIHCIDRASRNN